MPTTGDEWISLATGQILDFNDLDTNLVELLRESQAEARADLYGGDTTIGASLLSYTYALSTLDLDVSRVGTTPDGYRISSDSAASAWQNVPFADSGATLYHVGAKRQLRPSSVTGNTADGGFYYDRRIEDVGELGAPDTVTDQGAGAGLYIDIGAAPSGLVGTGWTVANTRPVVVYLVNPVTASVDAIYTGTIAWDGGAGTHRITIPHYLGQDSSAPSLTAADYRVIVQGPTITTTPLGSTPDYWFHAGVTSGLVDTSAQVLIPGWSSWLGLFSAQHDVGSGNHSQISAFGVDLWNNQPGAQVRQEITAQELTAHLATWEQNGGAIQNAIYVRATGTTPYRVETGAPVPGTYSWIEIPFRGPTDQPFTILGIEVGLYMLTGGVGEDMEIELVKRTPIAVGISNAISVAKWKLTKPAAATWENRSTFTSGPGLPHAVAAPGAGEALCWRLYVHETAAAQVQLSRVGITMGANRIEPF